MSDEQAAALIRRMVDDADFVARIEAAPVESRRAILREEGYGDVRLKNVAAMLPKSAGGELSDEDFAAVSGGNALTGAAVSGSVSGSVVTIIASVAMAL